MIMKMRNLQNRSLLLRLSRLEANLQIRLPRTIYYGWVPSEPQERAAGHLIPVNCQATASPNVLWCEFEERVEDTTADPR